MKLTVSACCAAAIALGVVACKDQQACEQSRLETAKTWKKVQENAATRATTTGDSEELTEEQKNERKAVWSRMEEQAHLVHGSFKTTQVTWEAAEKGRSTLQLAYQNEVSDKTDPMVAGFGKLLDEANAQHKSYQESCK